MSFLGCIYKHVCGRESSQGVLDTACRTPQDLLGTGGSAEGDFNPHFVGELQRQNDLCVYKLHTVDGPEIQQTTQCRLVW